MGLLKTILLGRPDGLRSKIRAAFGGAPSRGRSGGDPGASGAAQERTFEPAEKALGLRHEPPRDVTPPDGYEVVLHRNALDPGRIIEIIIGGTSIAVANVDGTYYAISNVCAHAGGPLGEGTLAGCIVTCPYHGWSYDLRDGKCQTTPGAQVATYPVQIVGDAVCVRL